MNTSGLHHVTALASDPQANLDFWVGLLGLRAVKRTVNFDAPEVYHFYFGDGVGSPGSLLTFFPWPGSRRGSAGAGMTTATAFAVPRESLPWWQRRLRASGVPAGDIEERFGEPVLPFADPDGLRGELVGVTTAPPTPSWHGAAVPAEHALRGLHGVTLTEHALEPTAAVLTETLGLRQAEVSGGRTRFRAASAGIGATIDVLVRPQEPAGRGAAGTVHHIAFRAADDREQEALRQQLVLASAHVSPVMERVYFRSIYFREPGGVLFEVATDGPGFAVDEAVQDMGAALRLPPWLERDRERIAAALLPLRQPWTPQA